MNILIFKVAFGGVCLSDNNSGYTFSYNSSNSFPQPLSPEEEEKYIQLLKNGDAEARNILIERNLRLVAHIVKKIFRRKGQRGFNFNRGNRAYKGNILI